MGTSTYKGFRIFPRPYQLEDSKRWTVDLEIRRKDRRQPFSLAERCRTEQEANVRCAGLARRIIDGKVPGWSVNHLRSDWGFPALADLHIGDIMRPLILVGILILGFGAFVLLRGASFTTRRDVLTVGEVQVTADQRQSIPAWLGGVAIVAGAALVVSGLRKKA